MLEPGTQVLIVEDVVTTGGSTVKAIERCLEEGLEIVGDRLRRSTGWRAAPRRSRRPAARPTRPWRRSTTSTPTVRTAECPLAGGPVRSERSAW